MRKPRGAKTSATPKGPSPSRVPASAAVSARGAARGLRAGGEKYGIRSISLALRILERLASAKGRVRLADLARELGTTKWRLFRHLHTLREEGYVTQDPESERFEVGIRLHLLAAALPRRANLVDLSHPIITELQNALGFTVVLTKLTPNGMVMVHADPGTGPVRIVMQVGSSLGFHESAHGKIALAFGPRELLPRVAASSLHPVTPKTITDPRRLLKEVNAVRARGWALSLEEHRMGMNAIAVPVYSSRGFEGALGFVYPVTSGGSGAPAERHRNLLVKAGREISRVLGAERIADT